jgi:L-malate glycosyltransferase
MRLLYIGNALAKHGKTPSTIDILSGQLGEFMDVIVTSNQQNKVLRLLDMLGNVVRHRKKVDVILIDTYSASNFYYALLSSLLARCFSIDYYLYLHGGNLPYRLKHYPRLSRMLFGHAKMNVAPSDYLKSAFDEAGYETVYIPNNIAIDRYAFLAREQVVPKLLYVRTISKVYNPQMAINALHLLKREYPGAKLCMVGPDRDGTLAELQMLVKELGLEEDVTLAGMRSKEEWTKMSREYDLFVNPTNFDNQPVSVIEAMALGLPVVSTNAGGLPFLIQDGENGLLTDVGDTEAFAAAITRILSDAQLASRLSHNGRRFAETFDWQAVSQQWKQLFGIKDAHVDL